MTAERGHAKVGVPKVKSQRPWPLPSGAARTLTSQAYEHARPKGVKFLGRYITEAGKGGEVLNRHLETRKCEGQEGRGDAWKVAMEEGRRRNKKSDEEKKNQGKVFFFILILFLFLFGEWFRIPVAGLALWFLFLKDIDFSTNQTSS